MMLLTFATNSGVIWVMPCFSRACCATFFMSSCSFSACATKSQSTPASEHRTSFIGSHLSGCWFVSAKDGEPSLNIRPFRSPERKCAAEATNCKDTSPSHHNQQRQHYFDLIHATDIKP